MVVIKRIINIGNVGNVFSVLGEHQEFKLRNVIYAKNGSGKTSISRVINALNPNLEVSKLNNFISSEAVGQAPSIEILFGNDSIVNNQATDVPDQYRIHVFNKDFCEKVLYSSNFNEKEINGELIIGEFGEIKTQINQLKDNLQDITDKKTFLESGLNQKLESLKTDLTSGFGARVRQWRDLELKYDSLFEKVKFQKVESNCLSSLTDILENEMEEISATFSNYPDVDFDSVESTLTTSYVFSEINPEIEARFSKLGTDWIKHGLGYHENHQNDDLCPFCGSDTITADMVSIYNQIINSEKQRRLEIIDSHQKSIIQLKDYLESTYSTKRETIKALIGDKNSKLRVETSIKTESFSSLVSNLTKLENLLKTKIQNLEAGNSFNEAFTQSDFKATKSQYQYFETEYSENVKHLEAINDKIKSISSRKTELRKEVAKYKFNELIDSETVLIDGINEFNEQISSLNQEVASKTNELPSANKKENIASLMNKIFSIIGIDRFIVDNDINLILRHNDDQFHNNEPEKIKNKVSEGEKNILALTYYFASLLLHIETSQQIKNCCLYIDDPVSSNSYEYIHGIATVLKKLPQLYFEIFGESSQEKPQIIISTHNLQLYNILAQNVLKKKANYYELINNRGMVSLIKQSDNHKKNMFDYCLDKLKDFVLAEEGNIALEMRSIVEIVCSFEGYNSDSVDEIGEALGLDDAGLLNTTYQNFAHHCAQDFIEPLTDSEMINMANLLWESLEKKYPKKFSELEFDYPHLPGQYNVNSFKISANSISLKLNDNSELSFVRDDEEETFLSIKTKAKNKEGLNEYLEVNNYFDKL